LLVAGIDIGAGASKSVIMSDGKIISSFVMPTGGIIQKAVERVIAGALDEASLELTDLDYVISTGYGRNAVPYSNKTVTEIICHAKGAYFLMPQTRTVVDIGCQDSKVIKVNENGDVIDFVMNDKCAAGTGRFLEVMAKALRLKLDDMGKVALKSKQPSHISSTCTVFAESEVISLRAVGEHRKDLVAGLYKSMISRVIIMGSRLGFDKAVVFTGGVAKSIGARHALEQELGFEICFPESPQLVGALGACLLAKEEVAKGVLTI